MSAFGGALHFDGRPIDKRWVSAFGAVHTRRGPDGGGEIVAGPAVMVFRTLHVTPESRVERQPSHDSHGLWVCWDGRLDNANELESSIGRMPGTRTDVAVVLAAYRRYGPEFVSQLVGDFALALWDLPRRRLLLARDCVGTRTLYFHCDADRVMWSTDLDALMRAGRIPLEIDDEFVADFLAYEIDPSRAPFRSVQPIRPAEAVSISADGRFERRQFWTLDLEREIRYPSDDDYADEFRSLFRQAVRVRLRTERPVAAELSGGLDSSSIVVMADSIVDGGPPRVETVSRVHEHARSSDERRFITIVEAQRNRCGLHLTDAACPLFDDIESFATDLLPNPFWFAAAYHRAVDAWMRELDSRVLLCGLGGDEIAGSRPNPMPELADLLVARHFRRLFSQAARWSLTLGEPFVATLYRHALRPVLPVRVRQSLAARRAKTELALYRPEYVKRASLRERLGAALEPANTARPSAWDQAAGFLTASSQIATGFRRAMCSGDITYPFLHRPLVEFMQAIPFDQRVRPEGTRVVQRNAMRGVLPDAIRERRSKGNPVESFARSFQRAAPALLNLLRNAHVVRRGYVDEARMTTELDRLRYGCSTGSLPIIRVLTLELWLRAIDAQGATLCRSSEGTCVPVDGMTGAAPARNSAAAARDLTCSTA